MHDLPFGKPGAWRKGNLHTHSTNSDGTLAPEEVCRAYRDAGYDFVAVTDHFLSQYGFPITDTRQFRTSEFTTLLGAELHGGSTQLGHSWHILAAGLPLDFAPTQETESGPELASRALAAGAFVAAAHPQWYMLSADDVRSLGPIHAIEVYNGCAASENDRGDGRYMLDMRLAAGGRYTACAVDDAHFCPARRDFQMGWVWVRCEENSPGSLLDALKRGRYYSSTGPEIHELELIPGNHVYLRCTPAESVFVTGRGYGSARQNGCGVVEAELDISRLDSEYLSVTVRDEMGRRAWTNPIWLAE